MQKKNTKKIILGAAVLLGALVLAGCGNQASQNQNNFDKTNQNLPTGQAPTGRGANGPMDGQGNQNGPGRGVLSDAEKEAIANQDYAAWQAAVGENNPLLGIITNEEQFQKYAAMITAQQSGDIEKAEQLREELGMPGRGRVDDSASQE